MSTDWLMSFNVEKCKVMHLGANNPCASYYMNEITLAVVEDELDLGVLFQKDLKWSKQCNKVVNTTNKILGMIKRTFTYLDIDSFVQLYKSLVRPHIDYCIQVWRPYLQKDIDALEKIQRRATRMLPVLREKSYEDRLKILNLTTLETRRIRGDIIQAFKIIKGFDDVETDNFFMFRKTKCTRGHSLTLFKSQCHLDIRKYGFGHRVVNLWNALPEDIIICDSLHSFKSRLDKFLKGRGFI